jgi:hypothetical protein
MKKLELTQMENIHGGSVSAECAISLGGAFVFGTGAIIAAAAGPVGWLAFAIVGNYYGWAMAAVSCTS